MMETEEERRAREDKLIAEAEAVEQMVSTKGWKILEGKLNEIAESALSKFASSSAYSDECVAAMYELRGSVKMVKTFFDCINQIIQQKNEILSMRKQKAKEAPVNA